MKSVFALGLVLLMPSLAAAQDAPLRVGPAVTSPVYSPVSGAQSVRMQSVYQAAPQTPAGIAAPVSPSHAAWANASCVLDDNNQCGNLTYHGGTVQHVQKVYTIFWQGTSGPLFPSNYQSTINQFVGDLNGSPYYAINSQYTDGSGAISTSVVLAGTWVDATNAIPGDFETNNGTDLFAEVERAITAKGWSADVNSYFQVYTPNGFGSTTGFCGYHTYATSGGNPAFAFGVILYPEDHTSNGQPAGTCREDEIFGTVPHDTFVDSAINTSAHEISETVTDPYFGGWFFQDGSGEIGDECNFESGPRGSDGSDVTMNGHDYLIQQLWSNAIGDCAMSFTAPPPPVPTAPTGLTVNRIGVNLVNISWNAVTNATSYNIGVSFTSGGPYQFYDGFTGTSINFTNFTNDTDYYWVVQAANASGTSANSAEVHFRYIGNTIPGDIDGDGKSELTVWRASTGTWFWTTSLSGYTNGSSKQFGNNSLGDKPLSGDIDGDGKLDLIVWRASTGTWYWLTSSSGYTNGSSKQFGNNSLGDIPMLGDIDGDGKADLIVWRASTGTFFWVTSSSGYTNGSSKQFGNNSLGDKPFVADVDGDGKADLMVWRASTGTWYWVTSSSGYTNGSSKQWGNNSLGDIPMVGDIDGDGKADLTVWRASTGTWFWTTSSSGFTNGSSKQFGNNSLGDKPIFGDIDGDGKMDLIVWRSSTGTWYWVTSSSGYTNGSSKQFGNNSLGDLPIIK